MDVQVDLNRVLEITRQRLTDAMAENVMLHCVVEQQQLEINQLKETIDKLGEEVRSAEDEGE